MKNEKLKMVITSVVIGEAGDEKAKFTLEYSNLDYGNVLAIEQKLVDFTQSLVELGTKPKEEKP